MHYGVFMENIKNLVYSDPELQSFWNGRVEKLQISIGKKDSKIGWYFDVKDGNWIFNVGCFKGDVFIDWNDEFKYKNKSRKQIKKETTPDFEINFKSEEDFVNYLESFKSETPGGHLKTPKVKGKFNNPAGKQLKYLLERTAWILYGQNLNEEDEKLYLRLNLFSIPAAVNALGKEKNQKVAEWLDSPRRVYDFGIKDHPEMETWFTVQDGYGKVMANQNTRLKPYFSFTFDSCEDAKKYFSSSSEERAAYYDRIITFKGEGVYDKSEDVEAERLALIEIIEIANETLR